MAKRLPQNHPSYLVFLPIVNPDYEQGSARRLASRPSWREDMIARARIRATELRWKAERWVASHTGRRWGA